MSINPITTTDNIREEYTKYLKSMFLFKNDTLRKSADEAIEESKTDLVKGPYIESTARYKSGKTLRQLIDEKILHKNFVKLVPGIGEFPLHIHQERAVIKSIVKKKNIIVATGTGSGKTESFLIPILNDLVKEQSNNELTPGVRALILYPMNALANDQLKRLRVLLKEYPEITFGRYTGETKEGKEEALDYFKKMNPDQATIDNEILSREEMRSTPPNILLTNYAMLEYLLLRPNDNVFFDGLYANYWKYIVLDEAHVYSGSLGSEISYLIARLKDRVVDGEKGRINFIATSATLGGGKEELKDVVEYAKNLFGESFSEDCIITSDRLRTKIRKGLIKPPLKIYKKILMYTEKYSGKELADLINKEGIYETIIPKEETYEVLYDILIQDYYVNKLKINIESKTKLIKEAIKDVFGSVTRKNIDAFLAMVDLAAKAKKEDNSDVLLPARYHTFSKSIEGGFVQLYPNKKVFLNRKEYEESGKERFGVFELANCQKCGQEYLIGKIESGYLKHSAGFFNFDDKERLEYFLLKEDYSAIELDEDSLVEDDELLIEDIKINNAESYILCTKCRSVQANNKAADKSCCEKPNHIVVYRIHHKGSVNTCLSCGSYGRRIVKKLVNADAPTTEMLGRTLYQNIPKELVKVEQEEINELDEGESLFGNLDLFDVSEGNIIEDTKGRKLLAFSDSRKEAAYFATYMDIRYNNYLWRKMILDAIDSLGDTNITFKKLHTRIYKDIESQKDLLIESSEEIDETISAYIMYELMSYEREIGLEGVGMLSFRYPKPEWWNDRIQLCGLDSDQVWKIIEQIFHGLRINRCVNYPDDLKDEHPLFGVRSKPIFFRYADSQYGIVSIRPKENYNNMRFDYLTKIFMKYGNDKETAKEKAVIFLEKIFNDQQFITGMTSSGLFTSRFIENEGNIYQLNHNKWLFERKQKLYSCNKCGKKTTINIAGVCPSYRCDGRLEDFKKDVSRQTYYSDIYNNIKRIPMVIKEHTAQLTSRHASEIQTKFEQGKVNILSCSTTFEMGVDVGSLEAVFLRNIPPETANYVQRAGRAGRRTSSTAYILTYAKRRSHDLYYFQNPEKIIEGQIKPPYIEKNNDKIAFRHLCSIVFSWIFRKYEQYFTSVEKLFAYSQDYPEVDNMLKEELSNHPQEILNSLRNVFTIEVQNVFGIEDWSWVEDRLLKDTGNLILSKRKWLNDVSEIIKIKEDNFNKGKAVDSISRMLKTFLEKGVINFLASNNVLPRYGFPIDTVNLDTIHIGKVSNNVNLSRDLKMAISEFAPGNKVIANGLLWESYSINMSKSKWWPTYLYSICEECHTIYKEPCDYNLKMVEIDESKKYCQCGAPLKYHKFIKPIFGFSTNNSKPEKPSLSKPTSSYGGKIYFHQYDENEKNYHKSVKVNNIAINYTYSPRGNLFIVNQGNYGSGFRLCSWCGYATNNAHDIEYEHKTKYGHKCGNTYLNRVDIGHEIITDIIEIELPNVSNNFTEEFLYSVLYALIEGAVGYLGIDRREIDGCLNYTSQTSSPSFILFDQVPGGAGHVKRIGMKLYDVIQEAEKRVSGLCECGEETSCYGCLRNYSNQIYHDILQRGLALKYFKKLRNINPSYQEIASTKENNLESIIEICKNKNIEMPVEGYELELKNGDMPIAELAFVDMKIALFLEEQEEEKDKYSNQGWRTYFVDQFDLEECIGN
ncbi:DEAD/DEAH box helicase [Natronospora cellulosivora (SeqCode)]